MESSREFLGVQEEEDRILVNQPAKPYKRIIIAPNRYRKGLYAFAELYPSGNAKKPVDTPKPLAPKEPEASGQLSEPKQERPSPRGTRPVKYRNFGQEAINIKVALVRALTGAGLARDVYAHAAMLAYIAAQQQEDGFRAGIPVSHEEWAECIGLSPRWARSAQSRLQKLGFLHVTHDSYRRNRYTVSKPILKLLGYS
jgi:hypothetical protein